jgi:hypothetical protein
MPSPSICLWQSFVDAFAEIGDGVLHKWITERGEYPDAPENRETNELLASLTSAQRRVLANMIIDSRHNGVFDTLVVLHERIAFNDGKYFERDVEMAFEPHGYTLFQAYIARKAGDPWRDTEDA